MATDWFRVITGCEELKVPKPTAKYLMHCTSCREVMKKDKCINKDCKYFNK